MLSIAPLASSGHRVGTAASSDEVFGCFGGTSSSNPIQTHPHPMNFNALAQIRLLNPRSSSKATRRLFSPGKRIDLRNSTVP